MLLDGLVRPAVVVVGQVEPRNVCVALERLELDVLLAASASLSERGEYFLTNFI
jgi:hypothetical protein